MTDSFNLNADATAGEGDDLAIQAASAAAEAAPAASHAAADPAGRVQLAQAAVDVPLPQPGQTVVVQAAPGATLRFLFDPAEARSSQEDGTLILSVNGGEVVIEGWESASSGEIPVEITNSDGAVINIADFLLALGISPETETEPAAGGEPAGPLPGTVPNAGAGFTPGQGPNILGGIDPEGPVDPTSLSYRTPERQARTEDLDEEEGDDRPDARDDGPGTDNDAACLDEAGLVVDGGEGGNGYNFAVGGAIVDGAQVGVTPAEGVNQFYLTAGAGFDVADIEAFFNLPANELRDFLPGEEATDGGAMKTEVTVEAGDTLSFSFNFLDAEGSGDFLDFAVVVIGDQVFKLADIDSANNAGPNGSFFSFDEQTGYLVFNYVFPAGGTYQLGFAVMNGDDTAVDSALLIDNIVITGPGGDRFVEGFESGADDWTVLGGVNVTKISDNVLDNDVSGPDTPISIVGITYVGGIGAANAPDTSEPGKVTITAADGSWVLEFYTSDANGDGRAMGDYTFTLLKPIDHPLPGVDDLHGAFRYTIADADGDADSATLTICIKDDVPSVLLEGGEGGLVLDETVGYGYGDWNANDEQASDDPNDIGYAARYVDDLFFASIDFGVDGQGDKIYALTLSSQGADSGLFDTQTGTPILLSQLPNGDIVGLNGSGDEVLRITIDSDGLIEVHQYRAVRHDDPADDDEPGSPESINPGLIGVSLTVTDGDGDTATATAELGALIEFEDDGPQLSLSGAEGGVTLDETDGDADDGAPGGLLASKTFAVTDFINVSAEFGSDDQAAGGGLGFALVINDSHSGLTDTLTNQGVVLALDGAGDIVGRAGAGGPEVLRISIDAATGEVTVTQSRALRHPDTGDHDEAVSMPFGTIGLTVTATDGDGDSVSDQIDLGALIRFEDDGPAVSLSGAEGSVVLDETVGAKPGDDNADDETGSADPNDIAYGTFAAAGLFNVNAGSDREAGRVYELVLPGGGPVVTDLLDTADHDPITLHMNGADVVGRNPANDEIFRITIDPATGQVQVHQYLAIHHDTADHDEQATPESIGAGKLGVKLTVTDKDGDSDSNTADLGSRIKFEDDGPTLVIGGAEGAIILDETDNDGDDGDVGGLLASANVHFTTLFPSVIADFGSDDEGTPAGTAILTLAAGSSGLVDAATNEAVVLVKLDDFTIVGQTENGGDEVFRITLDGVTGLITVTQSRAVEHDDPEDHDEAGSPESIAPGLVGIEVTITDRDGDSATDSVDLGSLIRFEDDGPTVSLAPSTQGVFLTLDESVGADAGDPNANDEANPAAAPGAIGFATAAAAALFTETVAFGSDRAAAGGGKSYELVLDGPDNTPPSGMVDTASSLPVLLVDNNGVIEGRAGGELVFTIEIDQSTGQVTVNQFRAVAHDDTGDHDESGSPESIDPGLVGVRLTVTDGDGDSDSSGVVELGSLIRFEDDGPTADLAPKPGAEIRLDETDGDADDGAPGGFLANVTVAGSALFTETIDAGSDGQAGKAYALQLSVPNADSGLDDTATGQSVLLQQLNATTIVGTIDGGATEVFRITVDATTGAVTVTQSRAVEHPVAGDPDEAMAPQSILGGLVDLTVNVTDGDGDSASDSIELGSLIKFEDDGPTFNPANAETTTVSEADPLPDGASGSIGVNFGSDGFGDVTAMTGPAGLTSGGQPITYSFDAATNVLTGSAGGSPVFTVSINSSGQYTFTLSGPIDHGAAEDSKALEFDFTVTDGDGDPVDGSFTVNVTDDVPAASNDTTDTTGSIHSINLVIVFDRSGSMDEDPNVNGFSTRIDLARAAIASLMAAYDSFADVNILIVDFAGSAENSGWLSGPDALVQANAYLAALQVDGDTNYAAALTETQTAYQTGTPVADKSVVYFLSDGNPNEGVVNQAAWENFLLQNPGSAADDITAFAVGIGNGVNASALEPIAFPNGNPANPVVLIDESQIFNTLLLTVTGAASGNVLTDGTADDFGADGEGAPKIISIEIDGDTYDYDGVNVTKNGGAPTAGPTLMIATALGGVLTFNFATGAYAYEAGEGEVGIETLEYTIRDGDGDTSTATLTINVLGTSIDKPNLVIGTDGNDELVANADALAEIMSGGDGDDRLIANDTDDLLIGGAGADELFGGGGRDVLIGGTQRELSNGTSPGAAADGNDYLDGGAGDDFLYGKEGADQLFGGTGADTLFGGSGHDYLDGGEDLDVDQLIGGSGNDTIVVRTNDVARGDFDNQSGTDKFILLDNINFGSIDGESSGTFNIGSQTGNILAFDGDLNISSVISKISGIETISMREADGDFTLKTGPVSHFSDPADTLTLSASDVIDLGGGTFDPDTAGLGIEKAVRVDGDAGDVLNLTGGGWTQITPTPGNAPAGGGYNVWVHDGGAADGIQEDAYVLVQTSVTVNAS